MLEIAPAKNPYLDSGCDLEDPALIASLSGRSTIKKNSIILWNTIGILREHRRIWQGMHATAFGKA